jgi:hypothetical protein
MELSGNQVEVEVFVGRARLVAEEYLGGYSCNLCLCDEAGRHVPWAYPLDFLLEDVWLAEGIGDGVSVAWQGLSQEGFRRISSGGNLGFGP